MISKIVASLFFQRISWHYLMIKTLEICLGYQKIFRSIEEYLKFILSNLWWYLYWILKDYLKSNWCICYLYYIPVEIKCWLIKSFIKISALWWQYFYNSVCLIDPWVIERKKALFCIINPRNRLAQNHLIAELHNGNSELIYWCYWSRYNLRVTLSNINLDGIILIQAFSIYQL